MLCSQTLAVLLVAVIGASWSQGISNVRPSRHKREEATTIVNGNVNTQARNTFTIGQNTSIPPGSQVIGVSKLTIAESGKLNIVMPDMTQLPDPLVYLVLNDSQGDALLNITHEQHNAQIVYNLKQSLIAFKIFCERMAQIVDAHILQNPAKYEDSDDGYSTINHHVRLFHAYLTLHGITISQLERSLNRLVRKIRVGEAVTDSDVARARQVASSVLKSHKQLAMKMLEALDGN